MKARGRRGFTLIEVVLSIAILAAISGFILQFFLSSDRLNKRSAAMDRATVLAVSVIEQYKAQETPELNAGEGSALEGADVSVDGTRATLYLDARMEPAGEGARAYVLIADISAEAGGEELGLPIQGSGTEKSALYRIDVTVEPVPVDGQAQDALVDLSALGYFVFIEEAAR